MQLNCGGTVNPAFFNTWWAFLAGGQRGQLGLNQDGSGSIYVPGVISGTFVSGTAKYVCYSPNYWYLYLPVWIWGTVTAVLNYGGYRLNGNWVANGGTRYHFDASATYNTGTGCPIAAGATASGPFSGLANGWPHEFNLSSALATFDTSPLNPTSLSPAGQEALWSVSCNNQWGVTYMAFTRPGASQGYGGVVTQDNDVYGWFNDQIGNPYSWNAALAEPTYQCIFSCGWNNPPPYSPPGKTTSVPSAFCGVWGFLANNQDGSLTLTPSATTFVIDQNTIPTTTPSYVQEPITPTYWYDHYGQYIYFTTYWTGQRTFYGLLTTQGINGHFQDGSGNMYPWDATWTSPPSSSCNPIITK